ncbi:MAG TPA: ABC transporter ATP-binding protein [Spirochaetia bacterium]|nr:ABC transporter ATP-binding protein [Spirochaetia bacterium]
MRDTYIQVDAAGRTYGSGESALVALEAASCDVQSGDHIAIVGPSGSGKSTLLHLMGGLDRPDRGRVLWPTLEAPEQLRPQHVSYVFQTVSLLPALTAVENVELPLLLAGADEDESRRIAREALDRMDLEAIVEKLPEELSGGQAQRVAVARALCAGSRVILADEPTGQLDHETSRHMFDVLLEAIKGRGIALVVATHDLSVANRLDSVWKLSYGKLEVQS